MAFADFSWPSMLTAKPMEQFLGKSIIPYAKHLNNVLRRKSAELRNLHSGLGSFTSVSGDSPGSAPATAVGMLAFQNSLCGFPSI